MHLFSKKTAPVAETSYQDVVDYLRDISQPDYTKILKVVNIYRDADKGVKKVLGIKENSVTNPATLESLAADFLDDDDTELGDFLNDDEPPKPAAKAKSAPKPKSKKIEVKE